MTIGVFRIAAVAAFLVPFALPLPTAADDAKALFARHKAYVGWAYGDGTLNSARETFAYESPRSEASPKPGATPDPLGTANAQQGEVRRELLYRDSFRSYGRVIDARGFTGSVFWQSNVNGYTVTERGRSALTALTSDVIDAEALAEVPADVRPDASFDGVTAAVVRIAPRNGAPADLFFSRDTGALLGYVLDPAQPRHETIHVISYAEFAPGKRYVSAVRFGDSQGIVRVSKFEANVPVSDDDLHPPRPQPSWTFGSPRSVPITVVEHTSMYSNSGGRAVHLTLSVNGKPGTFLFDSGAGGIIVFDPFAATAGLEDIGRTAYSGVNGGTVGATFAHVDNLTIGGNTLHDVVVLRGQKGGLPGIDGIIGYDVLARAVVNVDLTTRRLTITEPSDDTAQVGQGAYAFPVDLTSFHAAVPVKVQETVLPHVWLDTGDDFFVILPHDLETKTVALTDTVSIGGTEIEKMVYFGGVDGSGAELARCVRLNEIQVGPYRYQKAVSCFAPNAVFDPDGGLIGFDFLRHFNWTFDYPHNHVILTPNGA